MYVNRSFVLTLVCLSMSIVMEVEGEEPRKSRSIYDDVYQPRSNSIRIEDRDHKGGRNSIERSKLPMAHRVAIFPLGTTVDNSAEIREDEKNLFDVIMSKDYRSSSHLDVDEFDRIGDRMIARANITEEARRVVRQVKNQRPGFFWTLFRVAFETVNETRSAVQQISNLVESNFVPEGTTPRGRTNAALTKNLTTTQRTVETGDSTTTEPPITTTEAYKLNRAELQGIIRKNVRGLVRLFNIEWQDAINQSRTNVREFQRELGSKVNPYLRDDPDAV